MNETDWAMLGIFILGLLLEHLVADMSKGDWALAAICALALLVRHLYHDWRRDTGREE